MVWMGYAVAWVQACEVRCGQISLMVVYPIAAASGFDDLVILAAITHPS